MSILKDISELLKADIITNETAENIRDYYKNKISPPNNRLFIAFGVLGAILVGLGIILIIGHNWDELSKTVKTIFAFLPLVIGQVICGFVLTKKTNSAAWTESASAFLFFAIGASIALISQIYNIAGDTSTFILTWMLLSLPLIYLMRSSITSLLYICGITYYSCLLSYWTSTSSDSYLFWLLLLGALPHYYQLYIKKHESNFMIFHNWILPLSVIITLGTLAKNNGELMFIAYFSLFGLYYLLGNLDLFKKQKSMNNSFKILGSLGTIVLLLTLSFDWFWKELRTTDFQFSEIIASPEFFASAIISLLAAGLLFILQRSRTLWDIKPLALVFIFFIATFILGIYSPIAVVLINLYIFVIGIQTIREGARLNHLGILNFGLLVITALVICRFFDTDISFVIRGLLFICIGAGFFATNYWMLKKRNTNE